MEAATRSLMPLRAQLRHDDFFVARTPLLPLEVFTRWACAKQEGSGTDCSISEKPLIQYLIDVLARPQINEALYLASPSLHERYYTQPNPMKALADRKLLFALLRYVTRMSTRCTPFALFAGTSLGEIGETTSIVFPTIDAYQRRTRLDLRLLDHLTAAIDTSEPWGELRFVTNETCHISGGRLRYLRRSVDAGGRHYKMGMTDQGEELKFLLECARNGASLDELTACLVERFPSSTADEARNFIKSALPAQLLIPEWQIRLTGAEPTKVLSTELARYPQTRPAARTLEQATEAIENLDRNGITGQTQPYADICDSLAPLGIEIPSKGLLKVDLWKPAKTAQLSDGLVQSILQVIAKCQLLLTLRMRQDIQQMATRFSRRFEDAEVPLTMALDDECGNIAMSPDRHAIPLLDELIFGVKSEYDEIVWGPVEDLFMRKLLACIGAGAQEISLTDTDLDTLPPVPSLDLPRGFAAWITMLPHSESGQQDMLLDLISGATAAATLARFCHCDPELERRMNQFIQEEEKGFANCIVAELVHVPSARHRAENVLLRPMFHQYEIPYAARSGADPERQIPISDLLVSVRRSRFVLRSASLGREIIVRGTTSHAYRDYESLPVYRFLSNIQHQETCWSKFEWGRAFENTPFLPRVRMGNIVLSLARWRIERSVFDDARNRKLKAAELMQWMASLRERRGLPRYVSFGPGDNLLAVDLENPLCVENLLAETSEESVTVLTEAPDLAERGVAESAEGSFCSEILIPILNDAPIRRPPLLPIAQSRHQVAMPGSEWLYIKIYCSAGIAEQALTTIIAPLAEEATRAGIVDKWFFLRYASADTSDFHLRVRFHSADASKVQELWNLYPRLKQALEPLMQIERIGRIEIDTYISEVHRYGGAKALQVCEELFHLDSQVVTALLNELKEDSFRELRWQLAFVCIDQILSSFGWTLEWRFNVVRRLAEGFAYEFNFDSPTNAKLGELYRKHRSALSKALDRQTKEPELLARCLKMLSDSADAYRARVTELKQRLPSDPNHSIVFSVVSGLLHMHCNRMFASKPRESEAVMYSFLTRTYRSMLARQSKPDRNVDGAISSAG